VERGYCALPVTQLGRPTGPMLPLLIAATAPAWIETDKLAEASLVRRGLPWQGPRVGLYQTKQEADEVAHEYPHRFVLPPVNAWGGKDPDPETAA
jgi:hypothetical protein